MARRPALTRPAGGAGGVGVLVVALWEGYKALGRATNDGSARLRLPAHTDDLAMPHVWTIVHRFGEPELRGSSRTVAQVVLEGMWFTFRVAMVGFVIGVLVGLVLAILMQRFHLAERSLLPFVILSQTVPLVALAPLVVGWGGQLEVFGTNGSRGCRWLSSPPTWRSSRSRSAPSEGCSRRRGRRRSSWSPTPPATGRRCRMRLPAAVPYLVPALKLAAAAAVVGAIVAEISTGTRGGIGRLIIEYSRQATSDPAKVFTAIIGAAALGLVVAGLVALFDTYAMRNRPREVRS